MCSLNVKGSVKQIHEPQSQCSAQLHGAARPDIRIDDGNSFFWFLDPADGQVVGTEFTDRDADMIGSGIHHPRKQLSYLLGKRDLFSVCQAPVYFKL
jgi:hypothetical protein